MAELTKLKLQRQKSLWNEISWKGSDLNDTESKWPGVKMTMDQMSWAKITRDQNDLGTKWHRIEMTMDWNDPGPKWPELKTNRDHNDLGLKWLVDLILIVPVNSFSVIGTEPPLSWVLPVLLGGKCVLLKDTTWWPEWGSTRLKWPYVKMTMDQNVPGPKWPEIKVTKVRNDPRLKWPKTERTKGWNALEQMFQGWNDESEMTWGRKLPGTEMMNREQIDPVLTHLSEMFLGSSDQWTFRLSCPRANEPSD